MLEPTYATPAGKPAVQPPMDTFDLAPAPVPLATITIPRAALQGLADAIQALLKK